MPIRYMGTKRTLAPIVRDAILELQPRGRVLDLFSGMGSVASALAPDVSVVTNDLLSFTTAFARARFLQSERTDSHTTVHGLTPAFVDQSGYLRRRFRKRLRQESEAISDGPVALADYMREVGHVGSSPQLRRQASHAAMSTARRDYCLVSIYYSGGYFSTRQAIELDAIRLAIDETGTGKNRDWLLAAWIAAAGAVVNSPGHTAQFMKPRSEDAYRRIRRQWQRDVWPIFVERLSSIVPIGTKQWRASNEVVHSEAIRFFDSDHIRDVAIVYADPPYTRDQYSRFYHLYETMYLYDYPDSIGAGRYRSDRFTTTFSLLRIVRLSFDLLLRRVKDCGVPLVLSYPRWGLLARRGVDLNVLLKESFHSVKEIEIPHVHSTLGASSGLRNKTATEVIYVCTN